MRIPGIAGARKSRAVPRTQVARAAQQPRGLEHLAHRGEAKLIEQTAQPRLAAVQVGVMTESGQPADLHARLLRINLPGVQIEREGTAVPDVDLAQPRARHEVRQQPEVAASRYRDSDAEI